MISAGQTLQEIRSQYNNQETLEYAARQKIIEGVTDFSEMSRVIKLDGE